MIAAIIQARMSSRRLPGKMMKRILHRSMLQLLIERVCRAKQIDQVIVATSTDDSDDPIAAVCDAMNVDYYRGDLINVLDRYLQTARFYAVRTIVRITGDCVLIDPFIIDDAITAHASGVWDYTSNVQPRLCPDGLDVEVFSKEALERAAAEAKTAEEVEHVTTYMRRNLQLFKSQSVPWRGKACPHWHWSVDRAQDLEFARTVFNVLGQECTAEQVVELVENRPDIRCLMRTADGEPRVVCA